MTGGGGLDTSVPALIVRMDDNIFHHGTLGAVRSLGRAGIEVHAVLEGSHSPVALSRYLARRHTVEQGASEDDWVGALLTVAERIGRPAVLIPMDDAGAIMTAERRRDLAQAFLVPDGRADLPRRLSDKAALAGICRQAGVPHPECRVVETAQAAGAAVTELGLPVVAKWSRPWLLPAGEGFRSTTIVTERAAARALGAAVERAGSPLVLQAHLAGGWDADWFFHGYFDTGSRCLFGATGRKERSFPARAGLTTLGRWLANDRLTEHVRDLAQSLGFVGALDVDLRRDRATGAYHVLDVNPRLGAQFRLFTAAGGLDLVRVVHLDLTGRTTPLAEPAYGRVFFVENYDPRTALLLRRRQPDDRFEPAWYAADDLRPVAAAGVAWAKHVMRRAGRGRAGR